MSRHGTTTALGAMEQIYDLIPSDPTYDPVGDVTYDFPPKDDGAVTASCGRGPAPDPDDVYEDVEIYSPPPPPGRSGQPDRPPPPGEDSPKGGVSRKREMAIQEIVHTEKEYVHHLSLCVKLVLAPLRETGVDGVDVSLVFGNMEEIICVSQALLEALLDCTQGASEPHSSLGEVFEKFSADIETAYRPYCQNYEEAAACLKCCRGDPTSNARIEACEERLAAQVGMNADLSFVLIKPVQRVMRYTLLLSAVLDHTPERHAERGAVARALQTMRDVNSRINEHKLRYDLVLKYRRREAMPLVNRLSQIDLPALQKKGARLSQQFRTAAGLSEMPEDKEFETLHDSFTALHRCVGTLQQGVEGYLLHLQGHQDAWLAAAPGLRALWHERDDGAAELFNAALCSVADRHVLRLRSRLERRVAAPLSGALRAFPVPQLLVQKRFDKLLDHCHWREHAGALPDAEQTPELSRREYEALNQQLLEELPAFCRCVSALALAAARGFVLAHREFLAAAAAEMEPLRELMNIQAGDPNVLPAFLSACAKNDKILSRLQILTEDVPVLPGSGVPPKLAHYPAGQLHLVTANTAPQKQTDLRLARGVVVAVITRRDTQGNANRWLVDNGASRGFVKSSLLVPYKPVASSSSSTTSSSSSAAAQLRAPSIVVSCDSPPGDGSLRQQRGATGSGGGAPRPAQRPGGTLDHKRAGPGPVAPPMPTAGQPQPGAAAFTESGDQLQPGGDRQRSASFCADRGYGWAVLEGGGGGGGGGAPVVAAASTADGEAARSPASQTSRKHVAQRRRWTMMPRVDGEGGQPPSGAVPTASPPAPDGQEWCALFEFVAQGVGQVSARAGERVRVLCARDLAGNSEWWLVENDGGHRGYVPASFLGTVPR